MSRLLQKKALAAVNEALLQPSDYPGADDSEFNPGFFKGSEPEQIKHASRFKGYSRRVAAATFYHVTNRENAEMIIEEGFQGGWGDIGFGVYFYGSPRSAEKYAQEGGWDHKLTDPVILAAQDPGIRKIQEGELDPSWSAAKYADMFWHPMDEDDEDAFWKPAQLVIQPSTKTAEVELHESPTKLPPRNELRSRLDEDLKEEIDESKGEYVHFSRLLQPKK